MDAATAYIPVAYGLPGNTFHIGYNEKPYYAAIPGVSPGFHNPQSFRMHPDTIFVGGFPSSTTEKDLRMFFENYGEVKDVKLPHDEKGASRGYGFIKFSNEEMAGKILKAAESSDGKLDLNGRKINVARAMRRVQQPTFSPADYLLATPSGHIIRNPYVCSPIPFALTQPSELNGISILRTQMQFYNMATGGVGMQQQGQCGSYEVGSGDGTQNMRTIQDTQNQNFEQYQTMVASAASPSLYATAMMQQEPLNNTQQISMKEHFLKNKPIYVATTQFLLPSNTPTHRHELLPPNDLIYAFHQNYCWPMVPVPQASTVNSLELSYQQSYNDGAQRHFSSGEMHRTGFSRNSLMKSGQSRCAQKYPSFTGGRRCKQNSITASKLNELEN